VPQLRKDIITERWVIISDERKDRPREYVPEEKRAENFSCPFCPGNESKTPPAIEEHAGPDGAWALRVINNKYPVLVRGDDIGHERDALYESMNGIGEHEIIIESPDHEFSPYTADGATMARMYQVAAGRLAALSKIEHLRYAMYFKNYKAGAGATLAHPHSQIIAMPIVPKTIWGELMGSKEYFDRRGECVYCSIIAEEAMRKERVITENKTMIAISPYASITPFEVWILPKGHRSDFHVIDEALAMDIGGIVSDVYRRLKAVIGEVPFNSFLHTSPFRFPLSSFGKYFHWHLEIEPKYGAIAGFELGSGFHINPYSPEECTRLLRDC